MNTDYDYVLGVLAKPDGAIAVFEKVDSDQYKYITSILVPSTRTHNIQVKRLSRFLADTLPKDKSVLAIMVKPEGRNTDDEKTLLRVGYNVSTIKAVLDMNDIKTEWVSSAGLWQEYFNLSRTTPKEDAYKVASEIVPNIESTEQAESILIGVYGIETVLNRKVLNKSIEYYKSIPANALIDFSVMK